MKPALIFNQYIWIINTLKKYGKLTLAQLDRKWREDGIAEGNPLPRTSFNRHRDAIGDMFGINIDCDRRTHKYYISNPEVLSDDSIERHLFSTLAVHGMLADSASVRDRILMEYAPAGEEFLEPIIRAMKTGHRLRMGYQKFENEGYVKTVCPYAPLSAHAAAAPFAAGTGVGRPLHGLFVRYPSHRRFPQQTDIVTRY